MGKLGISMGVDVCYTNHMKADQDDIENLAYALAVAVLILSGSYGR